MGAQLKKMSGVLVVVLGIVMFNRGFDYSFISKLTKSSINLDNVTVSVIKDGYQSVTVRFEDGRYKPIVVQKGIPVEWTIQIESGDLNGCNNEIVMSTYDIDKKLDYGDNLIEFTPNKTGTFKYTCWMHMLSSYIYVVDDIASLKQ
jgi:plastocyanin domain-containing protein